MTKVLIGVIFAVTMVAAEPPVPRHHSAPDGAPSSSYGAPPGYPHQTKPAPAYGAPGYGESEPVKYEFKYDVDAPEYKVKFGHQESRDGEAAQGEYYVLLPDGRTQHVQYTADQDGYHPKVTYQGEAQGGYGRGPSHSGSY